MNTPLRPAPPPTLAQYDAYLEWAVHTQFQYFGDVQPDSANTDIGLLVHWRDPENLPPALFTSDVDKTCAGTYRGQKFATMTAKLTWLCDGASRKFFNQHALSVELASPITPRRCQDKAWSKETTEPTWCFKGNLVMACMDDGFAIANQEWLTATGTSRVLRMWDQAQALGSAWSPLDDPRSGFVQHNFGYGGELINTAYCRGVPPVHPLSRLPAAADVANDQAYYARVGLTRMRGAATHGAHVLDLMAGSVPARNRLSPSRAANGTDNAPPTWAKENDRASQAPLVLVQFPQSALDDPSGRWLGFHVLDGLHYILRAADQAQRVVVNLSWGPQTGPHDGSSLLEKAMANLVTQQKGKTLDITLPAGNSFSARAHARFETDKGCQALFWCIPPDGTTPSFLEIWWPQNASQIELTPPQGVAICVPAAIGFTAIVHAGQVVGGVTVIAHWSGKAMALIAIHPTAKRMASQKSAPHGRWGIQIQAQSEAGSGQAHIYIARADHNMGQKRKADASYLWDQRYEEMRRGKDGMTAADPAGASVQRQGTLNGIATGDHVHVAGGYRVSDGLAAHYSSSGPAVHPSPRVGPDWMYPADESMALKGIQASGVRSGSVFRLTGTSTAAPQLAREIANSSLPNPPMPAPTIRDGHGRR
jgi:hypothetical protein